jgi:hypothetical protein
MSSPLIQDPGAGGETAVHRPDGTEGPPQGFRGLALAGGGAALRGAERRGWATRFLRWRPCSAAYPDWSGGKPWTWLAWRRVT